ncbi:MAG: hypothetical protein WAL75_11720 [Terracidiphilus sp.]
MLRFAGPFGLKAALLAAVVVLLIAARYQSQTTASSGDPPTAASDNSSAPESAALRTERNQWIATIMSEAAAIRPGMQRKDLYAHFTVEGGISTRTQRQYVSKKCPFIKIAVTFEPVTDSDDPSYEDPEDMIVSVSPPYLQWSIMD